LLVEIQYRAYLIRLKKVELVLVRDEDPAARVQALSTLASGENADEGAVESALDAALTDSEKVEKEKIRIHTFMIH
jgi:hypothetical protein